METGPGDPPTLWMPAAWSLRHQGSDAVQPLRGLATGRGTVRDRHRTRSAQEMGMRKEISQ